MIHFDDFQIPDMLVRTLGQIGFTKPTPVQAKAIPLALDGRDILGSAQTGTGKTAAFAIPLVSKLMADSDAHALVITPTRELASQVTVQIKNLLGRGDEIKTALLIGGDSMGKQLAQLKKRPRIIIGTPGRINDHLERGSLFLAHTSFLVLDETDRMLDMGFSQQIDAIVEHLPKDRQTLLFSATIPAKIARVAERYLNNPSRVEVAAASAPAENITIQSMHLDDSEKYNTLGTQLKERTGSVIIFVKTKYGTEKMAQRLTRDGFDAEAIHGDLRQNKRDRVIASFRQQKYRILVATDVAARGLDIPHIEHVINYDLPHAAADYVHRIGRTARAGAEGNALDFISPADKRKWFAIKRLINPEETTDRPAKSRRPDGGKQSSRRRQKTYAETDNRFDRSQKTEKADNNRSRDWHGRSEADGERRFNKSDRNGPFKNSHSGNDRFKNSRSEGGNFEGNRSEGGRSGNAPFKAGRTGSDRSISKETEQRFDRTEPRASRFVKPGAPKAGGRSFDAPSQDRTGRKEISRHSATKRSGQAGQGPAARTQDASSQKPYRKEQPFGKNSGSKGREAFSGKESGRSSDKASARPSGKPSGKASYSDGIAKVGKSGKTGNSVRTDSSRKDSKPFHKTDKRRTGQNTPATGKAGSRKRNNSLVA